MADKKDTKKEKVIEMQAQEALIEEFNPDHIVIGGKGYDIYIGFDFVRELDSRYSSDVGRVKYGQGLLSLILQLNQGNPLGILNFIQAGTITEKQKPAVKDIEAKFSEWYDAGQLKAVYQSFFEKLEKSPITSTTVEAVIAAGESE